MRQLFWMVVLFVVQALARWVAARARLEWRAGISAHSGPWCVGPVPGDPARRALFLLISDEDGDEQGDVRVWLPLHRAGLEREPYFTIAHCARDGGGEVWTLHPRDELRGAQRVALMALAARDMPS